MDQSRSQVDKINQTKDDRETSGIQKMDALESLLIYLIEKFGPLTSPKLFELVACFGSHGAVSSSSSIEKVISGTLQNLMLEKHEILYCPEFGNWKLNDGKLDYSIDEFSANKALPTFKLRNVRNSETPLNIKGLVEISYLRALFERNLLMAA